MLPRTVSALPAKSNSMRMFTEWVARSCTTDTLVLDIGAGYDRNQVDSALQPLVSCLVGIDPSDNILTNPHVDERHQTTLGEFSRLDERRFDVICAAWVLEHVSDPAEFLSTCFRLLKPGGEFFAITPNLHHYFGLATKTSAALGLEDRILGTLMGPDRRAEYHFPTVYRANTIRAIGRLLNEANFASVEFRCCDSPTDYDYVVPEPLRWFPRLYSRAIYRMGLPAYMGRILFRSAR